LLCPPRSRFADGIRRGPVGFVGVGDDTADRHEETGIAAVRRDLGADFADRVLHALYRVGQCRKDVGNSPATNSAAGDMPPN
jgi:hypothetical protein